MQDIYICLLYTSNQCLPLYHRILFTICVIGIPCNIGTLAYQSLTATHCFFDSLHTGECTFGYKHIQIPESFIWHHMLNSAILIYILKKDSVGFPAFKIPVHVIKSGLDHSSFQRQIMIPRKILKTQQHMLQIKKTQNILISFKSILLFIIYIYHFHRLKHL